MSSRLILLASAVVCAVGVAACAQSMPNSPSGTASDSSMETGAGGAATNKQIAELRAATAKYHVLQNALDAGYQQITPCLELPGVGGMGLHYGKLPFNATVSHTDPEVLVYAPFPGGLKLVAAEFIVPQALSATPPSLFGHMFHVNPAINSWVLHAWVWEHNPTGMFEDWNPRISCSQ